MKWWGWGTDDTEFDIESKPDLWPYIKTILDIQGEPTYTPPVEFDDIEFLRIPKFRFHDRRALSVKFTRPPGSRKGIFAYCIRKIKGMLARRET